MMILLQQPEPESAVPSVAASAASPSQTEAGTQVDSQSFQTTELDLPESTVGILLLFVGLISLLALTVRTSLRDSRFLNRQSRIVLLVPRLVVLALVLFIVLNPQRRTQLSRVEKSRVGILLDTSLSMAFPALDATSTPEKTDSKAKSVSTAPNPEVSSRANAALQSIVTSGVLKELSKTHAVTVYTFDSQLAGPL